MGTVVVRAALVLRVVVPANAQVNGTKLWKAIVEEARAHDIAGFRGLSGFHGSTTVRVVPYLHYRVLALHIHKIGGQLLDLTCKLAISGEAAQPG